MTELLIYKILLYVAIALITGLAIWLIVNKSKLSTRIEEMIEKNGQLKIKNDIFTGENERLNKLIGTYEESYKQLNKENSDLITEIESIRSQIDLVKKQNSELNSTTNELKIKINSLELELVSKETELKILNENKVMNEIVEKEKPKEKSPDYNEMKREDLLALAKKRGIGGVSRKSKAELIEILKK